MKYTVYLETSEEALEEGGYLAHIPALPGCAGRGPTKEAALARCRETLESYLALLRQHGVTGLPPAGSPSEFEVLETPALTFPPDYAPLSQAEAEQFQGWMDASRAELLGTLARLPAEALDWRPTPTEWSIRQVVRHLANADWWYEQRLQDWPQDLFERLAATRAQLWRRLLSLSDAERSRVTVHNGEEWTARKVARRSLEHEREHLHHIRVLAEGAAQAAGEGA